MEPCRRSLAGRDSLTLILTRDRDMWVLVPANPVTATHTVIRLACSTYKGHGEAGLIEDYPRLSPDGLILGHHDKFDGSGADISVADVFDSLSSDRPYRKAMRDPGRGG